MLRGISLDLLFGLIFVVGQWRLAVLVLAWARARHVSRRTVLAGIAAFELLMIAGYAAGFSRLAARFPYQATAAAGAITFLCLLLSACTVGMHALLAPIRRRLHAETNPSRRRVLQAVSGALIAAPLATAGYGVLIERTNFQVRELDVPLGDLPPDLDGLRLLQLSDIHLGMFLSERELARIIDAACDLRPHVAFATGDFITAFGDPLQAAIRQVARVNADAGVFGCLGNHENYARVENEATALAARAGIRILRGQSCRLRFGRSVLNLAGVDYQRISRRERYLRDTGGLIQPGALNLLLSHNPDVFPVAARQGWNLVLAGHTHGGQVNVEILSESINPARFFTPYVRGLYRIGPAAEYVTRGIGTIGVPARLGAPPEISLLRLRRA